MAALGATCFWLAGLGRARADPHGLGAVGLLGLLMKVMPARWWPFAMRLLGSSLLALGLTAAIVGFRDA